MPGVQENILKHLSVFLKNMHKILTAYTLRRIDSQKTDTFHCHRLLEDTKGRMPLRKDKSII